MGCNGWSCPGPPRAAARHLPVAERFSLCLIQTRAVVRSQNISYVGLRHDVRSALCGLKKKHRKKDYDDKSNEKKKLVGKPESQPLTSRLDAPTPQAFSVSQPGLAVKTLRPVESTGRQATKSFLLRLVVGCALPRPIQSGHLFVAKHRGRVA